MGSRHGHKAFIVSVLIAAFGATVLSGCNKPLSLFSTTTPTPSRTPTNTATSTPSLTPSATNTYTPTVTDTPTITLTPTITDTPTITPSPTFDFPDVEVLMNAHCRYGPGVGYLHAIDLWIGDKGIVWNRNYSGTWLWVRFDKHDTACWVAASVLEVKGDVFTVVEYYHPLPKSTLYNAPEWVRAERNGDQVKVTWKSVWMTEDDYRGYMIEARLCQNGHLYDTAVAIDGTSYTFTDEQNCDRESGGRLYTLEKHGYSDWIKIPWPK